MLHVLQATLTVCEQHGCGLIILAYEIKTYLTLFYGFLARYKKLHR